MKIKKTIYFNISEDDLMYLYEDFQQYCFKRDIQENWETFLEFYNINCVEDGLVSVDEEYNDEDGQDTRYIVFEKMMNEYNKDFIEVQKIREKMSEMEKEYRKLENQINEIQHKYDISYIGK